jgi:hypothetical protein
MSLQMHRRMKGDAEWKSVTDKVEGESEEIFAGQATLPAVGTIQSSIAARMLQNVHSKLFC